MNRALLLMGGKVKPNTIIGGIGSVITTKSALATKLGISESIIGAFKLVGNDIHCKISSNYTFPNQRFEADSNITSYYDYNGHALAGGGNNAVFRNSTIQQAHFPAFTGLPFQYFYNCTQLNSLIAPNIVTMENAALQNAPITSVNFPLLTTVGIDSMRGTKGVYYVFQLLTTVNTRSFMGCNLAVEFDLPVLINGNFLNLFSGCTSAESFNLPLLQSIGNFGFLNCSAALNLYLPQLLTAGGASTFSGMSALEWFEANKLGTISDSNNTFSQLTSCERISIKMLKTFGNAAVHNSAFLNLKTSCKIETNIAMNTINSGSPHAALVWAKANRSAIVEFYDDSGNYVSTL